MKTKICILKVKNNSLTQLCLLSLSYQKFVKLEKDRKENDKIFNNLKGEVSYLSEKLKKMKESIDAQQQYSRRNCLLLHGIEETKGEDTDNIVLEVLNNDMGLNISKTALDRSHKISNPKIKKKS